MYKWESAHDWLYDRMKKKFAEEDWQWVRVFFWTLACQLDSDQIQDVFEHSMDKDGYFDEVTE